MAVRVFVAGHRGMVGSAILRQLQQSGDVALTVRSRSELNLLDQAAVTAFFAQHKPDQVYLAAAKVGGIHANNTCPADFIRQNLVMQTNIIEAAFNTGVDKLLFLGSSCAYPRQAPQPIAESALLTGPLEPTNEAYAIAKIAGIKLCESYNRQHGADFRSVMPTSLYGGNDYFHGRNSHVIPALLARFHDAKAGHAKTVTIWGTGTPRREFLHVDDMAAACVHVMNLDPDSYRAATEPMLSQINVGTGVDCTIAETAQVLADVTGYRGGIEYDHSKPDGVPGKRLNVDKLARLGWTASIDLKTGLEMTYAWYRDNLKNLRA